MKAIFQRINFNIIFALLLCHRFEAAFSFVGQQQQQPPFLARPSECVLKSPTATCTSDHNCHRSSLYTSLIEATNLDSKSRPSSKTNDNLLKFSKDVKEVVLNLRGSEQDPSLPEYLTLTSSRLSYSMTWSLEDWEFHNSRRRYIRYLLNFSKSRLLRRIAPQQTTLLIWTWVSIWIKNRYFLNRSLPISALGTISTFLAFLLTLRSNQGLNRLDEGRRYWSKAVLYTREMAQLISAFIYPVDKQLGLMLARHVAIFGWLLKNELKITRKGDVDDIVHTMLSKEDATYLLSQRQKPVAVITRIRQVIHHLAKDHRLSTAEEMALDHTAQSLSEVITATGRIRASPIPTLYTSHTSRLLIFYICCLPIALCSSGLGNILTTVITMVVGYSMFGLDEISHIFEQPFRVIPMYQISKRSTLAVADAMTCRPPSLTDENRSNGESQQNNLTTYWGESDFIYSY